MFRPGTARRDLERYRSKGIDPLERRMVDLASAEGLVGTRVVEIGGGIGAIQAELLVAGAGEGEIVELVDAYEHYAYELARERGVAEQVSYRVADLLAGPSAVAPADVVVLNRVVCCSPDGVDLTRVAAGLTRRTLLLVFPRDTVWNRAGVRLLNAGLWLLRRSFRSFVHERAALRGAAEAEGLVLVESATKSLWELAAFRRS